jgi:V/A-type H+-transporting ATPase subunit D
MSNEAVPTKGNLIQAKKLLTLAVQGLNLLDRKRNILVRELMALIERAREIQSRTDTIYRMAYQALQNATVTLGSCEELALTVPIEKSVKLTHRSVMGVEIPIISVDVQDEKCIPFGLYESNSELDKAYFRFIAVKRLTTELAEVDSSVYLLADSIKKVRKKVNALKNVMIPKFESTVKYMSDALEERERESFSRLKVIKSTTQR